MKNPDMIDQLLSTIYKKKYQEISALFAQGVDANLRDADGRTGLIHAVLTSDADVRMIRFLVEAGADVNIHDGGQQWTSLHFAARDNKLEIVDVLIELRAETDVVDCFGNTPLWRAVMHCNGDYRVPNLLLSNGADSTKKNNSGVSPLDLAKKIGDRNLEVLLQNYH